MAYEKYKNSSGQEVPRCTSIISSNLGWNKNQLIAWARREALAGNDPNDIKDIAAKTGTLVHDLIENHIYGAVIDRSKYLDLPPQSIIDAEVGFEEYKEWEARNDIVYLESEFKVVSDVLRFGGTIDAIAKVNNVVTLIDFKTSNGIYADHIIQVSAYAEALKEYPMIPLIEQVVIVHINKNPIVDGEKRVTAHKVSDEALLNGVNIFKTLVFLEENKKSLDGWEVPMIA
jgi:hypothetical protein